MSPLISNCPGAGFGGPGVGFWRSRGLYSLSITSGLPLLLLILKPPLRPSKPPSGATQSPQGHLEMSLDNQTRAYCKRKSNTRFSPFYTHIAIVVSCVYGKLVLIITPDHEVGFRRNLQEIHPVGLSDICKPSKTSKRLRETDVLETYFFESPLKLITIIDFFSVR